MGGGGKGSSGKVEFAAYLEDVHEDWLGVSAAAGDKVDNSIVDIMNSLWTTSGSDNPNPYTESEAYDIEALVNEVLTQARKVTSSDGYLNSNATHTSRQLTALNEWSAIMNSVRGVIDSGNIVKSSLDITSLVSGIVTTAISKATAAALQTVTDSKTHTDTITTGAIDKALEVINSQTVKDSIAVFSESLEEEINLSKARFSAGMAEANAVMSSAFIFGNSNIENAKVKAIERFTTELINRLYNQVILAYITAATSLTAIETQTFTNLFNSNLRGQLPFNMVTEQVRESRLDLHVQLASNMMYANISNELQVPQMYAQTYATLMTALTQRDQEDVRLNAEEKMWDLKVYNAGVSVLGGMNTGGGSFVPEGASKTSSTIGGGLSGAMIGAQIGSMVPGIGTTIGAGVGAVLGAFAGASE